MRNLEIVRSYKYQIALGVIVVLFTLAGLYALNELFIYTPDSARYIAWAHSLSKLKGFTDYTSPEATRYVVHAPLYSLLLAPIAFLFPKSIIALKFLNVFIAGGTILILYRYVGKQSNNLVAIITAVLFALHPFVLILSTQILSEIVFGFFFLSLLYCLETDDGSLPVNKNFYLIGAALLGCIFSREVGLAAIPVVCGFFLYRKQYTKAILIFFIPVIVYSIWYIRNDVLYAVLENPDLKNSSLILNNVLTPEGTLFIVELWARAVNNIHFYAKELTILVFSPVYYVLNNSFNVPWMAMINQQSASMKFVTSVIGRLYWIIGPTTIVMTVFGMWMDIRHNKNYYLKFIFLAVFVGIILIYPVVDIRFLFPILLLMILWIARAIEYCFRFKDRTVRSLTYSLLFLLLIPNILWSFDFVITQHKLREDPLGTFMDSDNPSVKTHHWQFPLPFAAAWLNQHCDSASVILSPYKELSFFLDNKKVVVLKGVTPLNFFNDYIRDYDIKYLVSSTDSYEWRDYEYQIGLNTKYSFKRVFAKGAIEVYKILPHSSEVKNSGRFARLLENMRIGNYAAVDSSLIKRKKEIAGHPDLNFLTMITKQSIGEMDSVQYYASRLDKMPQGLLYAQQAAMNKTIITIRQTLEYRSLTPYQRAELSLLAGTKYWAIDLWPLGLKYARRSLTEDSTYALAYVYNIYFSFQVHDTDFAVAVYKKLRRVFPDAELTAKIDTLMDAYRGYRTSSTGSSKAYFLEKIFDSYNFLGFSNLAIDNGLLSLQYDPRRSSMYEKLGELYDTQNKHYPSFRILQKARSEHIENTTIDSLLHVEQQKLYMPVGN